MLVVEGLPWHSRVMPRHILLLPFLLCTSLLACETKDDPDATPDERLDFPPVECGEMTCDQGLICVMPSEECDYDLNPPDWVQPALECAPVPDSCADMRGTALDDCLWQTLCLATGEYSSGTAIFADGTLDCPVNGLDCFE